MESNPPPNIANLNQYFNEYDADHDGEVNSLEVQEILKQVGYNDIYIGTIKKVNHINITF
jgi:Ca2+-binding EF-hand superfamily protein